MVPRMTHRKRPDRAGLALVIAAAAVALFAAGVLLVRWMRRHGPPAPPPPAPTVEASPTTTATAGPRGSGGGSAASEASGAPAVPAPTGLDAAPAATLEAQRQEIVRRMREELLVTAEQAAAVEAIFARGKVIGQGNPDVSKHPMTRAECMAARAAAEVKPVFHPRCGVPHMAPVFDPKGGSAETAPICIDQFEFPGVPCEYPVVYASARDAAELCRAIGKRICDAHEWEGACAGALRPLEAEYDFTKPRKEASFFHNKDREKVWSYGKDKDHGRCATKSAKSDGCVAGGWRKCGSNTYPTGSFPACAGPLQVFDLHGNAAEHMNLPTKPDELARGEKLGHTEMKGSWFIFSATEAHEDDCRWRAPDWHPSRVMDVESHRNYHLGFRCCKDAGGS